MILVEDRARLAKLELVFGFDRPREIGHPLEVGSNEMAIGCMLGQRGEALEFALGLGGGLRRQLRGLDALAKLVHLLRSRVALADLRLDLAHPPTEQLFTSLRIALARAGLLGESLLRLGNRHLAIEVRGHSFETLARRWARRAARSALPGRAAASRRRDR